MGPHNIFTEQFSDLPTQLDSVGMNCAFKLVCLQKGQLHMCNSLLSHASAPLLKILYAAPTLQHQVTDWFSTLHLPKKQKVSLGQGWLQPAGASDRLRCCNVIILGD